MDDYMMRIEVNPKNLAGKPVIAGTRISVDLILNLLAHGYTFKRIIKAYPELQRKDIVSALMFAERRFKRQEFHPPPSMEYPHGQISA